MSVFVPHGTEVVKQTVETCLREKRGCLIGRFGTIECEVLYGLHVQPGGVGQSGRMILEKHAGIFPPTGSSVRVWAAMSQDAFANADVLATGWYAPHIKIEKELLQAWGFHGKEVTLRALEPYYAQPSLRWSSVLKGKRVCVVTSFAKTAAAQVRKPEAAVWPDAAGSLWAPDVEWSFVQTGYAPCLARGRAGWEGSPESWEDALEDTLANVMALDPDVVLIGCGGLGMPLGGELKKAGKVCLVLGGALQVLFGICGERWAHHEIISNFWNSEWVWPLEEETPAGAVEIESACYWRRR